MNAPGSDVSHRRGYLAPSTQAVARAMSDAAMRAGPVVAESVTAEVGRLGRLTGDLEVFAAAAPRADGLDVVTELAMRELERGRWMKGAGLEVTATDASGADATATGKLNPGERSALVRVPLAAGSRGPWKVRVRVTGDGIPAEDRIDVAEPAGSFVGAPIAFRGAATARQAPQPVAQFLFRRGERLRVEWPIVKAAETRTARVLDRRGQPIGAAMPVIERTGNGGQSWLLLDLPLALAEGDYVIELTTSSGADSDIKLLAFRIGR